MTEHKQKLIQARSENNTRVVIEVLLSLRVNALQISPELRKNLVYELIRNDVFLLVQTKKDDFIVSILKQAKSNSSLCHAILSLLSVIVSTLKGVEYIVSNSSIIVEYVLELLQQQADGTVNQRFCIAILQKVSIKEETITVFLNYEKRGFDVIDWVLKLVERSTKKEIHIFALDFATAFLANILHAPQTQEHLTPGYLRPLLSTLLNLIPSANLPTSVLMHLLICLSYLKRDRFASLLDSCSFVDRISDFVEYYSKRPAPAGPDGSTENGEIDKRTVLDLCAHMFHPKEGGNGNGNEQVSSASGGAMDYNDMRAEDKIREFENEQGDLIFECFQDEEKMFNL